MLLLGTLLISTLMAVLWAYSVRRTNSGVMDIGWAAGLCLIAALCALVVPARSVRAVLASSMVMIWGLRLATHLYSRVINHPEDPRYAALRDEWGSRANIRFFWFFQIQAVLVLFLSFPLLLVMRNDGPLSWWEYSGIIVWCVAIAGEWISDRQLKAFKSRFENKGRTCRSGLWKYSRHPNYFFEWLFWIAIATFAMGSPFGYLAIACPLLMLYFLLRVTGIPATEAQALRTRGQDYRDFHQTTSAFVPWLPGRRDS